jgi:hypothetical protein
MGDPGWEYGILCSFMLLGGDAWLVSFVVVWQTSTELDKGVVMSPVLTLPQR